MPPFELAIYFYYTFLDKFTHFILHSQLKIQLQDIFKKYDGVEKVLLFGSRARRDNKPNSDIDICLIGKSITHLTHAKISMDVDELNTPLSFDILNFNDLTRRELIDNILNEGIVIYNG
ncbi:MAG: nucleotidyltransferase domain-containing protein [Peptostreptococcaceae bacterium]